MIATVPEEPCTILHHGRLMEKHSVFVYDTPYDDEDEADEATFRKNDKSAIWIARLWGVSRYRSGGSVRVARNSPGVGRTLIQRWWGEAVVAKNDYTSQWITSGLCRRLGSNSGMAGCNGWR